MTLKVPEHNQYKLLKITTIIYFIQADTFQEQLVYYEIRIRIKWKYSKITCHQETFSNLAQYRSALRGRR